MAQFRGNSAPNLCAETPIQDPKGPTFASPCLQGFWRVFSTHLPTGFQKTRAASRISGRRLPQKDIVYKRLDVRVAKTFKMPWGHELTADFEAFNVFNRLNRTYST
jgi:hypothetical protein